MHNNFSLLFFFSSRRRHTRHLHSFPTRRSSDLFMPPNLGGFFMVRSYYPSECHADYFDFERIEALKPAIEACGISTLSQSPMLGFHKQMDNRIKLLEAKHWRSEERFSRNAETDLVCRLLLEKKKNKKKLSNDN